MIIDFHQDQLLTNDDIFDKYTKARKVIKQYNNSYPAANDFIIDKYGTYLDQSDYIDRHGYGIIIRTGYKSKYSFEQLEEFAKKVLNVYCSNPLVTDVIREEGQFSKSVEVTYVGYVTSVGD